MRAHELTICERIIADVITGCVSEEKEQGRNASSCVFGLGGLGDGELLERDSHGDEAGTHGRRREHEHPPATESGDVEGGDVRGEATARDWRG